MRVPDLSNFQSSIDSNAISPDRVYLTRERERERTVGDNPALDTVSVFKDFRANSGVLSGLLYKLRCLQKLESSSHYCLESPSHDRVPMLDLNLSYGGFYSPPVNQMVCFDGFFRRSAMVSKSDDSNSSTVVDLKSTPSPGRIVIDLNFSPPEE
ncbi:hypothetical protein QVD17_13984 [Tagetes erecta]|uniref:Uncharacterized protein n=1 Tax=Tagetes erecta TaxID=13708 RepID=A0AAD8KXN9_TARER|nr:hypothetical protein QVD17_13984 [Tagetes erecta]